MAVKDYLITFFSVAMILALCGWVAYGLYWVLKKGELFKRFAKNNRKKKMKDYEFEDKIIDDCFGLLLWDYYDVKRYLKYRPKDEKNKVLYTLDMLNELSPDELKDFYERRYKNNGITKQGRETRLATQEDGKTIGKSGYKKLEYYREGKTSHYLN